MSRRRQQAAAPEGPLRIRYARLRDAVLWDRNPKLHDMGGIVESIRHHGFRDAPILDAALGAIVAGNGRTTALAVLREEGPREGLPWPPTGIVADADGEWWMPFQTGIDSASREEAEAFGLDHNLLTPSGGDLGFVELVRMFDHDRLVQVAEDLLAGGVPVVVFDADDLRGLVEFGIGQPEKPEEGAKAVRPVTCPQCGHEFVPEAQ